MLESLRIPHYEENEIEKHIAVIGATHFIRVSVGSNGTVTVTSRENVLGADNQQERLGTDSVSRILRDDTPDSDGKSEKIESDLHGDM